MKTKLGKTGFGQKNDTCATVVRLIRELQARIEENDIYEDQWEPSEIENIVGEFLRECSEAVRIEVQEG